MFFTKKKGGLNDGIKKGIGKMGDKLLSVNYTISYIWRYWYTIRGGVLLRFMQILVIIISGGLYKASVLFYNYYIRKEAL